MEREEDVHEELCIRGTLVDGSPFEQRFSAGAERVCIGEARLRTVDLSELSKARHLRELQVSSANLETIDLSPVASSAALEKLTISSGFHLKSIDLSPLSQCTHLKTLDLANNTLGTVDLAPLAACTELRSLVLLYDHLTSIDLTPLRHCERLMILMLRFNPLKEVDFTSVALHPNLIEVNVDSGVRVVVADDIPRERIRCTPLLSYLSESGGIARNYVLTIHRGDEITKYSSRDLDLQQ